MNKSYLVAALLALTLAACGKPAEAPAPAAPAAAARQWDRPVVSRHSAASIQGREVRRR